jgi:dipeptidyl-peptidase-3
MMNGLLTQLTRIEKGRQIEESHMRNRALIARWLLDRGSKDKVMELKKQHNKTYLLIHDYEALRQMTGQLLAEVQRIKSEGDYPAAQLMVENYAFRLTAFASGNFGSLRQTKSVALQRFCKSHL